MSATGAPDGVRSMTAEEARSNLAEGLRFAVPLHIAEIRHWPADRRRFYLPPGGLESLGMADAIMFQTRNWRLTARAFNAYARTLAILAYEPVGVTLFGVHFCTAPHDGCPHDWTPRPPVDWAARIAELRASASAEGFPDPGEWAGPRPAARVEEPRAAVPRPRPVVDAPTGGVL